MIFILIIEPFWMLKSSCTDVAIGTAVAIMVGDKVPLGDEFWLNYMDLLTIVDILLSPELTEDDVAHPAVLIKDHHQEFVTLYPHASVTPKMHYLVHMPRLILP